MFHRDGRRVFAARQPVLRRVRQIKRWTPSYEERTNEYHGTAYAFFQNRYLNAFDSADPAGVIREKISGREDDFMPRSDFGRFGGNIGGPILKNKPRFFPMSDPDGRRCIGSRTDCPDLGWFHGAAESAGTQGEQLQYL
jgi:hypothetical protein